MEINHGVVVAGLLLALLLGVVGWVGLTIRRDQKRMGRLIAEIKPGTRWRRQDPFAGAVEVVEIRDGYVGYKLPGMIYASDTALLSLPVEDFAVVYKVQL